jgi:hypothetical protein
MMDTECGKGLFGGLIPATEGFEWFFDKEAPIYDSFPSLKVPSPFENLYRDVWGNEWSMAPIPQFSFRAILC